MKNDQAPEILACPICKSKLIFNTSSSKCSSCGERYLIQDDIPSFLSEKFYDSNAEYGKIQEVISFWNEGWKKRLKDDIHTEYFNCGPDKLEQIVRRDRQFHKDVGAIFGNEIDLSRIKDSIALNIGCGAGLESLLLASAKAYTIGLDITHEAAKAGHFLINKIGGQGFGVQADSRHLPFRDSSFDIVYSSGVLHHSPKIEESVAEIYRVLRPDGKAFIMLYSTWSFMFLSIRIRGILKGYVTNKKQSEYMSSSSEGAWIVGKAKNPHTDTFSVKECRDLFKEFKNIKIRKGGLSLVNVPILQKIANVEKLENYLKKYLPFIEKLWGACIFIEAQK